MKPLTCLFLLLQISVGTFYGQGEEDAVTEWIAANFIPLQNVQPGNGFGDLQPLNEIVGDARIVALGEPTHGNREVFQLKHRMIEYLVEELDFNIFALECPFGEALDVNNYIIKGQGSPEEALAGVYYWTWENKEIVELLKWMRNYNADSTHSKKIKFYGFDTQDPERAARFMLEYLQEVDPSLYEDILPELNILQIPFSNPEAMGRRPYIPEEYDDKSFQKIRKVMLAFDENKEIYINKTDPETYQLAKQHARQVEMWIEANFNDGKNYLNVREKGQAENINWILKQEGGDSKVFVWAHNSHVANAAPKQYDLMGKYLKSMLGEQLKIFGFFFNQGGFNALDVRHPSKGIEDFTVGLAAEGTLEYKIAAAGHSLGILDMNDLPAEGPVDEWFHSLHPTRHSGAGYDPETPEHYFWTYAPAEAFDALVYLEKTSPATPINKSDFDAIWLRDKKLNAPSNLSFESNKPGELPGDWLVWSRFERLGVRFEVTREKPFKGQNSVLLERPERPTFGELTPNLTQAIDATPYRGKKIRVSAATRGEVPSPGFAFFRLVIEPDILQSAHEGSPPLFDSLDEVRVTSDEWEVHKIEAFVPETANTINYGIYLRDTGKVWLDNVQVEIME